MFLDILFRLKIQNARWFLTNPSSFYNTICGNQMKTFPFLRRLLVCPKQQKAFLSTSQRPSHKSKYVINFDNMSQPHSPRLFLPPLEKDPLLDTYLNEWSRKHDILYQGYLWNHLSHNLVVIGNTSSFLFQQRTHWSDGGQYARCAHYPICSEERFNWWTALYSKHKLDPPRELRGEEHKITEENWRNCVATTDYLNVRYPEFLKFFDEQVAAHGMAACVRKYVPEIGRGLSGSALHPIIHLGLGLEASSPLMVAEGLASLCSLNRRVGAPEPSPLYREVDPGDMSNPLLIASENFLKQAVDGRFYEEITRATQTRENPGLSQFQMKLMSFNDPNLALGPALNDHMPLEIPRVVARDDHARQEASLISTVEEAQVVAAAAYLASDCEFFVIHGLTSLHSTLVTMQELPPAEQMNLLVHWWRAAMATLCVLDIPNHQGLLQVLDQWRNYKNISFTTTETSTDNESGRVRAVTEYNIGGHALRLMSCDELKEFVAAAEHSWYASMGTTPPAVDLVLSGVGLSISGENEDLWWSFVLRIALLSTDEHGSKAVYSLWRWSTMEGLSPASKRLFMLAAQNQVRVRSDKPGANPADNIWFF